MHYAYLPNLKASLSFSAANAFAGFNDSINPIENVTIEPGKGILTLPNDQHLAIGKSGWFDTEKADAQATLYIDKQVIARFYGRQLT